MKRLLVPLAIIAISGARATDEVVAAPVTVWDDIAARVAQADASGQKGNKYSHDKAALENRPIFQAYYRDFANWKMPAADPVPDGKLANLPERPTQPRFPLSDQTWPEKYGEASICLWEDDKLAAASFSVDDNNAADLPAWREISKRYGDLKITWFLISRNIGKPGPKAAMAGTWDGWQAILNEGFQVQSHSVTHVGDPVFEDGWPGPDWECAESRRQIDVGLPGHTTKFFAPPGGSIKEFAVSPNWRASMVKVFAGARGFTGTPINRANMIDYFDIRTTANPSSLVSEEPQKDGFHLNDLFNANSKYYRGWVTVFTHSIGGNPNLESSSNPINVSLAKVFDFWNRHRDDIWIGFLGDVALYGQERDTATLKTDEATLGRISLTLSSKMDPRVFNYPLTLKVRVDNQWEAIEAKQDGRPISAKLINHEGAVYALVKAVPDSGQIQILDVRQ